MKIQLRNNDLYRHKENGRIMALKQEYNGIHWYLWCRDDRGVHKTLSVRSERMIEILEKYYEKIEG